MKNIEKEFLKFGYKLLSFTQNDESDKIEEAWFGNGDEAVLMENTGKVLFIKEGKSTTNDIPEYLNETVNLALYELFGITSIASNKKVEMTATIRIPKEMKKEIKLKCVKANKSLTDVLNFIVKNFKDFDIDNLKNNTYKYSVDGQYTKMNFRTDKNDYKNFKLYCISSDLEITHFLLSCLNINLDYILENLN